MNEEIEKQPRAIIPGHHNSYKSIILIVASIVVIATVIYSLWHMKYGKYHDPKFLYGLRVVNDNTQQEADKRRDAYLQHAKVLRNEWQPWAFQHKQLIASLLNARQGDRVTLMHTFSALPDFPQDAGIQFASVNLDRPSSTDFTWNPSVKAHPKIPVHYDPQNALKLEQVNASVAKSLMKDFVNFHDIKISQSFNSGMSHISLWASGRITEDSLRHQRIPGAPVLVEEKPKQIVPPYDFIGKGK